MTARQVLIGCGALWAAMFAAFYFEINWLPPILILPCLISIPAAFIAAAKIDYE